MRVSFWGKRPCSSGLLWPSLVGRRGSSHGELLQGTGLTCASSRLHMYRPSRAWSLGKSQRVPRYRVTALTAGTKHSSRFMAAGVGEVRDFTTGFDSRACTRVCLLWRRATPTRVDPSLHLGVGRLRGSWSRPATGLLKHERLDRIEMGANTEMTTSFLFDVTEELARRRDMTIVAIGQRRLNHHKASLRVSLLRTARDFAAFLRSAWAPIAGAV